MSPDVEQRIRDAERGDRVIYRSDHDGELTSGWYVPVKEFHVGLVPVEVKSKYGFLQIFIAHECVVDVVKPEDERC